MFERKNAPGGGGIFPLPNPQKNRTNFKGKIVLFTTFYKQYAWPAYTLSLISTIQAFERLGINYDYWQATGETMPWRSINAAMTRALEDPDVTDFLNIDADESWDPQGLLRLLTYDEEVVAGSYRMTNDEEQYVVELMYGEENGKRVPRGRILGDGTALLRAKRVSGGFLRIKKSVLEKFVKAYPDRWYQDYGKKRIQFFGHNPIVNHAPITGDILFSDICREIGVELWCDPNIQITHWNMREYPGNFDQFLRTRGDAAAAVKIVKAMADDLQARKAG